MHGGPSASSAFRKQPLTASSTCHHRCPRLSIIFSHFFTTSPTPGHISRQVTLSAWQSSKPPAIAYQPQQPSACAHAFRHTFKHPRLSAPHIPQSVARPAGAWKLHEFCQPQRPPACTVACAFHLTFKLQDFFAIPSLGGISLCTRQHPPHSSSVRSPLLFHEWTGERKLFSAFPSRNVFGFVRVSVLHSISG